MTLSLLLRRLRNPPRLLPVSLGHVRLLYLAVFGMVLLKCTTPLQCLRDVPELGNRRWVTEVWASVLLALVLLVLPARQTAF